MGSFYAVTMFTDYLLQVESPSLTEPLWDATTVPYPYPNNAAFVREYTIKLLSSSFPNMTAAEVSWIKTFHVDSWFLKSDIDDQ